MRKKFLHIFILCVAVFLLFVAVSCKPQEGNLIYYGYFESDAFVLVYNSRSNVLYYVDIPLGIINRYAKEEGFELFTESLKDFAGLVENGVILSTKECFVAIKEALEAFSYAGNVDNPTESVNSESRASSRLQVLSDRAEDFLTESAREKISILCGMDLSPLFNALKGKNAKTVYMKSDNVVSSDLAFSRDYFRRWISQIL